MSKNRKNTFRPFLHPLIYLLGITSLSLIAGSGLAATRSGGIGTDIILRDCRVRLLRVDMNDSNNMNDDSAYILVRTATSSQNLNLQEYESIIVDDYEINMLNVVPDLDKPGSGTARINITALR